MRAQEQGAISLPLQRHPAIARAVRLRRQFDPRTNVQRASPFCRLDDRIIYFLFDQYDFCRRARVKER
jgi:hypothetical protein